MFQRKQIIIETETKELLIIHQNRKSAYVAWCEECRTQSQWLNQVETAQLSILTAREIFRLAEAEEIHFQETPDGQMLVCLNSLALRHSKKPKNLISPKTKF